MIFNFLKKKKRKGFWFEDNQDAQGYQYGDSRAWGSPISPAQDRRDAVRRSWNI